MTNTYMFCNKCQLNKSYLICSDCCKCICNDCLESMHHLICNKCNESATCYHTQVCYDCRLDHYNMIDDFIAIGDCESSYNNFDIIINLFAEDNGCELNEIKIEEQNNKIIYNVGLIDDPELKENALYLLATIIPKIIKEDKKILFHCYAGVSRSATFAIAYLIVKYELTVNKALQMVKSKRSMIEPNHGFMEALHDFYNIIN
jgi:hypothetical protein